MMWRATFRPGMREPFVCACRDHEVLFDRDGLAHRVPIRPCAKAYPNGTIAAVSQSREGAIASVLCVIEEERLARELSRKRDRS